MLSRQSVLYGGNEISSPFTASGGGEGREARIKDTTPPYPPNNNNSNPGSNKTRLCVCSEQFFFLFPFFFRVIFFPSPFPRFPCKLCRDLARRNISRRARSSLRVTWSEPPPQPRLRSGCSRSVPFYLLYHGVLAATSPGLTAIVPRAPGLSARRRQRRPRGGGVEGDGGGSGVETGPPRPLVARERTGRAPVTRVTVNGRGSHEGGG